MTIRVIWKIRVCHPENKPAKPNRFVASRICDHTLGGLSSQKLSLSMGIGHSPDPPSTEMQVNTVSAGWDARVAAVAAPKAANTRASRGLTKTAQKSHMTSYVTSFATVYEHCFINSGTRAPYQPFHTPWSLRSCCSASHVLRPNMVTILGWQHVAPMRVGV